MRFLGQAALRPRDQIYGRAGASAPSDVRTNLVLEWDNRDLTGTDGANYTGTWTDRIAGSTMSQSTAGSQPIFTQSVSAFGGLPGLTAETGSKYLDAGRPAALISALGNHNNATGCTSVFVVKGRVTGVDTTFAALWSPNSINDASTFIAGYKSLGYRNVLNNLTTAAIPFNDGFQVIINRSFNLSGSNKSCNTMHNGWIIPDRGGGSMAAHATNNYYYGGVPGDSTWFFRGDLGMMRHYNRALTNAECFNLTRYIYWLHGYSAPPWVTAGAAFYAMTDGDSYESLAARNWPLRLAQAKSHPYSALGNVAVPSRTSTQMKSQVNHNFLGVEAALGIPLLIFTGEFYNQPDANASNLISYLADVRTAAPGVPIVAIDAWDNGKTSGGVFTDRASYNTALAAALGTSYDVLAPISGTSEMGVEGACPNTGGTYTNTKFADDVGHPSDSGTDPGTAFIASYMSTYWDAGVALL